jgi:glycosyltransferase involved in cell wall biosynthesis
MEFCRTGTSDCAVIRRNSPEVILRVLLVHNRYQQPGGEDGVVGAEADMLRRHLHQVEIYEANNDGIEGPLDRLKTAVRCVWSPRAERTFRKHLRDIEPDVIHVHNFFPLISPAVHHAAYKRGIPVVQTLHNYRLLCPASTLLRDGVVCEACTHEWYPISAVRHACYRKSHAASFAVANMLVFHRLIGTWTHTVSRFIALSEFARRKFVSSGLPEDRVSVKPNFLADDPGPGYGNGDYVLFVGRLTDEKGIPCLLQAWKALRSKPRLIIVGDGPLASMVRDFASTDRTVQWLGFLNRSGILELMGNAFALIFPSIWYEAFPLVLAESFAKGLPVIASNLGSMAEIVSHRRTGLLFAPGSSLDLANTLQWAFDHRSEVFAMRKHARLEFESKYTADRNYRLLLDIYEAALPALAAAPLASAV